MSRERKCLLETLSQRLRTLGKNWAMYCSTVSDGDNSPLHAARFLRADSQVPSRARKWHCKFVLKNPAAYDFWKLVGSRPRARNSVGLPWWTFLLPFTTSTA